MSKLFRHRKNPPFSPQPLLSRPHRFPSITRITYLLLGRSISIELKVHNITILNKVLFPFLTVLASCFDLSHTLLRRNSTIVRIRDNFSLDKTTFHIGVNGAGSTGSIGTLLDSPATNLFLTRSEEVNEGEFLESLDNHLRHAATNLMLVQESLLTIGVFTKIPQLGFKLNGERDDDTTTMLIDPGDDFGEPFVLFADVVIHAEVNEVHAWLGGDNSVKLITNHFYLLRVQVGVTNRLVLLKSSLNLLEGGKEGRAELTTRRTLNLLCFLLLSGKDVFEILLAKLHLNGFKITNRINTVVNVNDLVIIKRPNNMENSINGTNMTQEIISKSGTFRSTPNQTGDIGDIKVSRVFRSRLPHVAEPVVTFIRNWATAFIRFDGAERVVLSGNSLLGQKVEKGRFADVRKTDNTHAQVLTNTGETGSTFRLEIRLSVLRRHSYRD
mmetsp:Transcript_22884/g.40448  ORF Transcript_22884/g.40448 Transcript_22884/m.40448 type:complete len:441 (-) Transcript_22884:56-1378(-)